MRDLKPVKPVLAILRSKAARWSASAVTLLGLTLAGPLLGSANGPNRAPRPTATRAQAETTTRHARPRVVPGVNIAERRLEDDAYVVDTARGETAFLSLDAGLQQHLEAYFARYEVPEAGLVAMDPTTGRVLAYINHRGRDTAAADMATSSGPPAASVFKIITGAALLDAGVRSTERVCYHGGESRLGLGHLDFNPETDRTCATLAEAMGGSLNAVFARLSDQHLNPATMERYGQAFGFGQTLPFDLASSPSALEVPTDRLEFARASAGFWHSHLSPLHGALIASTIANGGAMPRAGVVDRLVDGEGHVTHRFESGTYRQVIGRETAT